MISFYHILHRSVISFYLPLRLWMQGLTMNMLDVIFLAEIVFEPGSNIAQSIVLRVGKEDSGV